MATVTLSNRLPIVIAAGLFGLAVLGAVLRWGGAPEEGGTLHQVPAAPDPTADSPATVLKTLSIQMDEAQRQTKALQDENRQLSDTVRQLRGTVERAASPPLATPDTALLSRMQELADRVRTLEVKPPPEPVLPVGAAPPSPEVVVWVEPLDADAALNTALAGPAPAGGSGPADAPGGSIPAPNAGYSGGSAEGAAASTPGAGFGAAGFDRALTPPGLTSAAGGLERKKPVYTLPANSTLLGATAWTALLGRVPVGERVRDPFRFKLLTGRDNLAANGHTIPGIEGMVWSGVAVGDLALACVRGEVHSVTYIFQDGTIQTVHSPSSEPLGWISDDRGVPCVRGELKTNAPQVLTQRTALLALQAAADAAAAAETTTSVSGFTGGATSSVTGDQGRYVLGRTLAGGAEEARRWVEERDQDTFDAILVRPGAQVAINLETEIPIDYDPAGRRISHERRRHDPYTTPTLD